MGHKLKIGDIVRAKCDCPEGIGTMQAGDTAEVIGCDAANALHLVVDSAGMDWAMGEDRLGIEWEWVENGPEVAESGPESGENEQNCLFSAAKSAIIDRSPGYGHEDAFSDIAERWNLWLKQRFGAVAAGIVLTPADAADLLKEYKAARRLVRQRGGMVKRDDRIDEAGYLWWLDKKGREA